MPNGCTDLLVSFETFTTTIIHFIGENLLENCVEGKDHDNGSSIMGTVTTTEGQESCKHLNPMHTLIITIHLFTLHHAV